MGVGLRPRLARLIPIHHRSPRWSGPGVVVEAVAVAGSAALLVGRRNSLMSEFRSLRLLHGLAAVAGRRCEARGARGWWPGVAREGWVTPRR